MTPYEILGVPKDASDEDIRQAWRVKSLEAHPDREGGSHDAQTELNIARDILLDPTKRATIDAGEQLPVSSPHSIALQTIVSWASSLACDEKTLNQSVVVLLREQLMDARVAPEMDLAQVNQDMKVMQFRFGEVSAYPLDPDHNPVSALLEKMIQNANTQLTNIKNAFLMLDEVERIINSFVAE
jgi:hypothetical protein